MSGEKVPPAECCPYCSQPLTNIILESRLKKVQMYLAAFILNRTAIDIENKSYWRRQELRADREIMEIKEKLGRR